MGDGCVDLAGAGSSYVCVLRGRGAGAFEAPLALSTGGKPTWIEAGDLDLAVSNLSYNDILIYENDGQGRFTERPLPLWSWGKFLTRK